MIKAISNLTNSTMHSFNTPLCTTLRRLSLFILLMTSLGVTSRAEEYAFISKNSNTYNILSNNNGTATNVTKFSYNTCVWNGASGSSFSNNGRYLYLYNGTLISTNSANLTINNYKIYYPGSGWFSNSYYLRYNNGWTATTSQNQGTQAAYTVSTINAVLSTPSISNGTDHFTAINATSTYSHSNSSYTPQYYTLTGPATYYATEGSAPTTTQPSSTTNGITYTWTFSDGSTDNGYARIDNNGQVTYYNSYLSDTNVTIKVTATHTASGTTSSGTKTILFDCVLPTGNPVSISAIDLTIAKGNSTVANNYTLTAASGYAPYKYVSATSNNQSIATITNNNGSFYVTGVSEGSATITIRAYNQDNTTVACSTTFTVTVIAPESGVSGTIVTLNDLEDHSWSYYSDASLPAELRSLNPADVTITYFGNGTSNVNVTTNSTTPADNNWTSSSSTVQVSNNETANTFVYYKTLERTDGSSSLNPTGRCAYTVIPNPFSKRPTFTISGTKYYTGFYKWKVTKLEGGAIYDAKTGGNSIAVGGTIDGDQTIYFAPNSEYGMVVEMVALWARAYYTTGYNDMNTYVTGTNAYERNFHVVTSSNQTASYYQKSYPVTISSYYPDGTSGGGNFSAGSFSAAADTKIEYISIGASNSNTWSANGKNFVIGRGVTGTVNNLFGLNGNATSSFSFRVESGTYNNLYFLGQSRNFTNDAVMTATLGSDYDRATSSNNLLRVTADIALGMNGTIGRNNNPGAEVFKCTVKSGNYDLGTSNYGGGYQFYLSAFGSSGTPYTYGKRTLIVEGGIFSDISGGMETDGVVDNSVQMVDIRFKGGTVNSIVYGAAQYSSAVGGRRMVFTGGEIKGWIAGGANGTKTDGGALEGDASIYFGGNAVCSSNGSNTTMGAGNATGGNIFGAGSGNASAGNNATVGQVNNSVIVIADDCYVERNVYGGGNYGFISDGNSHKSDIYFYGGNVDGSIHGGSNMQKGQNVNIYTKGTGTVKGGIYGGSNQRGVINYNVTMDIAGGTVKQGVFGGGYGTDANSCDITGTVNITMSAGTVLGGLYGGGNVNSKIGGKTTININGGTIGSSSTNANVYGGGLGSATRAKGSIEINIGSIDGNNNTSGSAVIYGDVYGGSAKGVTNCNDGGTAAASGTQTDVTLNSGTINGNLYGGGHGIDGATANVWGPVAVQVNGGKVTGAVFGCNNENGTPKNSVTVTINGTDAAAQGYALNEVYGGGNKASYVPGNGVTGYPKVEVTGCDNSIGVVYGGGNAADVPSTDVTIWGGTIGQVFGGGHGNKNANPQTEANVSGNVAVKIYGGTIDEVFAGSNSKGSINGNSCQVTIENQGSCEMDITDVYGGGNEADGKAGTLSIGCGAVVSGNIYGGAKNAAISNDITLNITGGNLNNIFGGNNQGGNISGTITVNIEKADDCSTWHIGTVYGGGNVAAYSTPNGKSNYPQVNIKKGAISGSVYGGGLGETARVTGNPQVTVTGGAITGNIYGGGEAAPVTGNPVLTLSGNNTSAADIYGGGKGTTAVVTGNSSVTVSGGTYSNVFGGGEAANLSGSVTVNIQGGTISNDVYGGGALAHTNTANLNGNVITPKTNTTTVNLTGGTMKNVYGGGLGNSTTEAKVYGDVFVNLNKGVSSNNRGAAVTDYLFGCNNVNGTPLGSVTVYVQGTQNSGLQSMLAKNNDSYDMKAIYGGGNLAAYIPAADTSSTHVILNGCRTISAEYVYGGGNAAPVPATDVKVYGTYKVSSIFGGGNGKDALPNGDENPGADVGIYKVTEAVYNATAEHLQYKDPGNEKGDDKYILYGNIAGSSIIGTTNVMFLGGIVDHLFGGSNTKGDIIKQANVVLGDEDLVTCDFNVNDVYGGSNEAYMSGSAAIDINCIEGMNEIYGGSRMADVNNDVVLTITGGTYGKVFGGNNISGRIFGSITVNIEQTGCLPIVIDELYGGGNQAPYSVYGYTGNTLNESGNKWADPTINIISCESIGKVFGGGLGAPAIVIGDPHININMVKGWTNGDYKGNGTNNDPHAEYKLTKKVSDNIGVIGTVFGGGNEAIVQGQTTINIGTEQTVTVKNVSKAVYNAIKNTVTGIANPGFAQSDGDAVTKDLTIQVEGANITGNVYGGGNNANVTGGTNIQVGKNQ